MAILKSRTGEVEVPDGTRLEAAAEELGVPFGCRHGVCGACVTPVLEGIDNLNPVGDEEESFGLAPGERMMCQCSISSGTVVLDLT